MAIRYCVIPTSYDGFLPLKIGVHESFASFKSAKAAMSKLLKTSQYNEHFAIIKIYSK